MLQFFSIFYMLRARKVHLQEDGLTYRNGIVCIYTVLPTRLLDLMHAHSHYTIPPRKTVSLKMNPRVRNM